MLNDLLIAIKNESTLTDDEKVAALEEVQNLVKTVKNSSPPEEKGIAKSAIKYLKMALKSIPDAAKILEACAKLLSLS